jgi:predicted TPR repeat methyltransferase
MQNDSKISLDDAYALKTPADNVALYRHWAETYDVEFAQNRGYQYPQKIADIYAHYAKPDDNPILDVGSGNRAGGHSPAGTPSDQCATDD